ncbi:MAG: hypothetical protein KAR06_04370 [Deltaproteobacteria bacterium]|nr:hypothetical protein [Deltaproteobacteria bacterium]
MGELKGDGLNQEDLISFITSVVTLVNELKTNLAILTAQLDADATVTDETYATNCDASSADLSLTQ